jgi:hypothetical protein
VIVCAPRLTTTLVPAKPACLSSGFQPRLKVVVQIVREDDPGAGNRATVGERRPVEFGVAVRADDCDKVRVIAGDVRNHVTEYAESRNYGWLASGLERASRRPRESDKNDPHRDRDAGPMDHQRCSPAVKRIGTKKERSASVIAAGGGGNGAARLT